MLADVRHEPLWLAHPDRPTAPRPTLISDTDADLLVIGGGLSGLWTALRAKQRRPDERVVLLEGDRIASAASGRNGGFMSASITHGHANGLARWPQEFGELERLGRRNLAEIERTLRDFDIDCDYARVGEFDVATEPYQLTAQREHVAELALHGVELQLLDAAAMQSAVASPSYLGATFDPDVATVDPARLCWGLARAVESLGVVIHERTTVSQIEGGGRGGRGGRVAGAGTADSGILQVRTGLGATITARRVALTGGAHAPLLRRIDAYVVPVFDHVVATAPLPRDVRDSLRWEGRQGVADSGNLFHYYRLTPDDRILWGGYDAIYARGQRPGSPVERDDAITARLVQHLHDTFPQVADVPIEFAWAGAIDTCSRFSAFWGRAYSGRLAYVAGYTGLGVGASRFGAEVLLDLLWDEDTERTRLDMVRRKPLPFPPNPLRSIGIDLTRRSLAAADARQGRRNLWLRTLDRAGLGFDS